MTHTVAPTRIVRLGDANIWRIQVLKRKHWWSLTPEWTFLRVAQFPNEGYGWYVWEGTSLLDAQRMRTRFIEEEQIRLYRDEENWIVEPDSTVVWE